MSRFNLDQKNKTLTLSLKKVDEKKLSRLSGRDALSYVLSTMGYKQRLSLPKFDQVKKSNYNSVQNLDSNISSRPDNYYLTLFRNSFKIGAAKPSDSLRYFGVEIECFIKLDELDVYRNESGGDCECSTCEGEGTIRATHRASGHEITDSCPDCDGNGYNSNEDSESSDDETFSDLKQALSRKIREAGIKGVDIKQDGSLECDDSDYFPVEFTVLVPQNNFSNLEKLCNLLAELKTIVNKTCGLHAHVDMRGESKESILKIGAKLEKYVKCLAAMVPETRRVNTYCKLQASNSDRYSAINLCAFEKQNTIEIRLHSATTDFKKISNWLKIIKTLLDSKEVLTKKASMKKFLSMFEGDLKTYIQERIKTFNGNEYDFLDLADDEDISINEAV